MFPDEKKAQFLPFKELLLTSTFPAQGFTMLEVLAALMISFAFLMGALNGITMAVWMQVKAERQAQANYWIQQDLENIRYQASIQAVGNTTNRCSSDVTQSYAGDLKTQIASTLINGNSIASSTSSATSGTPSVTTSTTTTTATSATPLVNKFYGITRIARVSSSSHQILTLSYTVGNTGDVSNMATLYTEIIPPNALSCS